MAVEVRPWRRKMDYIVEAGRAYHSAQAVLQLLGLVDPTVGTLRFFNVFSMGTEKRCCATCAVRGYSNAAFLTLYPLLYCLLLPDMLVLRIPILLWTIQLFSPGQQKEFIDTSRPWGYSFFFFFFSYNRGMIQGTMDSMRQLFLPQFMRYRLGG